MIERLIKSKQQQQLSIDENLTNCKQIQMDQDELIAPIANIEIEDFLDMLPEDGNLDIRCNDNDFIKQKQITSKSNLGESADLCNSLEDLVKTFDRNVKECFTKYKNIDVGQLAPVQVRLQDDIINDSQMWYTLTGNFGDLLPINYWTKPSLIRKYHSESLNLKQVASLSKNRDNIVNNNKYNRRELDLNLDSYENLLNNDDEENMSGYDELNSDFDDEEDESYEEEEEFEEAEEAEEAEVENDKEQEKRDHDELIEENNIAEFNKTRKKELVLKNYKNYSGKSNKYRSGSYDMDDYLEFDENEDLDELREQLDMHSMILSKSVYEVNGYDEPIITAEQVLDEIDSIINMEDYCDEMTPDSGYYPSQPLHSSSMCSSSIDLPIDSNNVSYIKYINTFAVQNSIANASNGTQLNVNLAGLNSNITNILNCDELSSLNFCAEADTNIAGLVQLNHDVLIVPDKDNLRNLNVFELNALIEQIENTITSLSDTLVTGLALRDELEFEKETRNTFITLLTNIQEKRRHLSIDDFQNRLNNTVSLKKKNKRNKSMTSLNFEFSSSQTYLTTVIPFNNDLEYTVQHLQILNKLLKAINEDSHQVPELLTNYILKVVCPT